jgi:hypothetical protein
MTAERGHDFDTLDGVHTEVAVEAHVEVEHLDGGAGFLGDDEKEGAGGGGGVEVVGCRCNLRG